MVFSQPPVEYAAEPVVAREIPIGAILLWCWLPAVIFLSGKRLFQLACIVRLWRRYPRQRHANSAIIAVDRRIQPFSFFNRIFLNPSFYSGDELDEILAHEQVHCRQRHTIDILLAEAFVCLCWFNPAAWLLRHDLKQNLEFYTDRMTLRSGFNRKHYQYSLLRVSGNALQIVNHFHNFYINHLKKRIIMINKKNSPRIAAVKYLLVVPVLTAVLLVLQMSGLQAKTDKNNIDENSARENVTVHATDGSPTVFRVDEKVGILIPAKEEKQMNGIAQTNANVNAGTVSGFVYDETFKGLPGVNIAVKGTTQSVVSGMNGDFNIQIPEYYSVLTFSCNGYKNRELNVKPDSEGDVIMYKSDSDISFRQPEDLMINFWIRLILEKRLFVVDEKIIPHDELYKFPTSTIKTFEALNGKKATDLYGEMGAKGVIIITTTTKTEPQKPNIETIPDYRKRQGTTYAPDGNDIPKATLTSGDLQLRIYDSGKTDAVTLSKVETVKFTSLRGTGNEPLYIVDGKEIEAGSLGNISSNDIESISVLKNASANSQYGEKGKNGVFIITTKRNANATKSINTLILNKEPQSKVEKEEEVEKAFRSWVERQTTQLTQDQAFPTVRGTGNNRPLIIVDGKEFDKDLNTLSPDRIESIEILKNASAYSQYGEKGKNGVVIVTLKNKVQ